jgi:hypothetical protein
MKRATLILFLPVVLTFCGIICNGLALAFNHDRMPVLVQGCGQPDQHWLPPGDDDERHSCWGKDSHLLPLIDWIPFYQSRASVGDMFLFAADGLKWPCLIVFAGLAISRRRWFE